MTPEQFAIAQQMEGEGWEYRGMNEDGDLCFNRFFKGLWWVVDMRVDR
jgi:hypothetical protein